MLNAIPATYLVLSKLHEMIYWKGLCKLQVKYKCKVSFFLPYTGVSVAFFVNV